MQGFPVPAVRRDDLAVHRRIPSRRVHDRSACCDRDGQQSNSDQAFYHKGTRLDSNQRRMTLEVTVLSLNYGCIFCALREGLAPSSSALEAAALQLSYRRMVGSEAMNPLTLCSEPPRSFTARSALASAEGATVVATRSCRHANETILVLHSCSRSTFRESRPVGPDDPCQPFRAVQYSTGPSPRSIVSSNVSSGSLNSRNANGRSEQSSTVVGEGAIATAVN